MELYLPALPVRKLKLVLFIVLALGVVHGVAQDASDYILSVQADLVKTDNASMFGKGQFGIEANYFINDKFTAATGLEFWTDDDISFVIGTRFYPAESGFIRLRGLVGANDLSIGGGWVKPLNKNFRLEAIADFYFSIDFSIRAGIVYMIPRD
jgi:hypothetical protein